MSSLVGRTLLMRWESPPERAREAETWGRTQSPCGFPGSGGLPGGSEPRPGWEPHPGQAGVGCRTVPHGRVLSWFRGAS